MLTRAGMNLIALVTCLFRFQGVGNVVFDGRKMLRTRISHHAVFGAAEHFIDGPVHCFAENVPEANIGRGALCNRATFRRCGWARRRNSPHRADARPLPRAAVRRRRPFARAH